AMYADMGHFGRRPIRVAWLVLVMPALVLSYFGQGALVLSAPGSVENPFFAMVPKGSATLMLVALSSAATVIASQALISGAFSLTRQALQLGYFPRVTITHTAAHTEGQIYVPQINWVLAIFCLLLVIGFQRSDRLASAYGIAVTGTMALTSVVYYVVTRHTWKWPTAVSAAVLALFLSFDVPFFVANTVKILDGGWVPVLIGIGFIAAMLIWSKGRTLVIEQYAQRFGSIESALPRILEKAAFRVPGTAVFMSSSTKHVPPILAHVVQHMHAVSEHVFLLTVSTETVPAISDEQRIQVIELSGGFYQVVCRYGFMERPNVPEVVREAAARIGVPFDLEATTYFLGRERVLGLDTGSMGRFAEQIYGFMQRNAVPADLHFQIPVSQVIEIGIQLDL
ncbi:MAG TPA: KUP/HAK/KT family potassium transporter, partial [Polyangiaceae bacterium]|nr:KUP/HAK/KT family potassium transporter [Polyangiaceae bacterium]